MPRFSFQPLGDSWALVLALLAALVVGLLCLAPNARDVTPLRRKFELGLRFAVVLLFAVLFARPSIVTTVKEELPASVVFLCDNSESMSIRDGQNGESRFDAMKRAFDACGPKFKELCDRFDVRALGFSDSVEELDVEDGKIAFPTDPKGQETRLGDALAETLRETAGKRLLGVALLGDGAQRAKDQDAISPQDQALRMRDAERKVYAFHFGSTDVTETTSDVAVLDLRASDHVFLGNELTVSGQVRVMGYAGQSVPLTLSLENESGEMEVVDQTTLETSENDATLSYQFTCRPQTVGEWKLGVSTPLREHELVETNNELDSFVEVLDRGTDALYIEGTRRYEQNFLRAALESASDVRIRYWRPSTTSLVGKSPNKTEAEMVAAYAKSRKSLEQTFFGEGKYPIYILGDVDATAFQPSELEELVKRVEEGAGLVVLAGERALSLGGYANTPLADALPVQTSASDRLPLESDLAQMDEGAIDSQRARYDEQFLVALSQARGKDDFVTRLNLDPKKNAETWRAMPPLSAIYRLGKLKPNASTLLVARRAVNGKPDEKSAPLPLLVTQNYGAGRVAVLATDSTWRWRMRGKGAEHAKFWRQLILWAAKFDDILEGELAIELERSRFAPDEQVDFRALYRPKPGEDTSDMTLRAEIVAPDGEREQVKISDDQGSWRGFGRNTSTPGDYLVEAQLQNASGQTLQTARARFLVYAQNLELEKPEANPAALENLANTTEGRFYDPDELPNFVDEMLKQRETFVDEREAKRSLYDVWAIFLAFVAIMTIDWLLRKRWGLV